MGKVKKRDNADGEYADRGDSLLSIGDRRLLPDRRSRARHGECQRLRLRQRQRNGRRGTSRFGVRFPSGSQRQSHPILERIRDELLERQCERRPARAGNHGALRGNPRRRTYLVVTRPAWSIALQWVLWAAAMGAIMAWLARSRARTRPAADAQRLTHPRSTLIVGLACSFLFSGVALASALWPGKTGSPGISLAFLALDRKSTRLNSCHVAIS